jgi:2-polyprenyl-3-methyl-5-hydroxy-6-metoxy-1,4-benzoquinol methylase
MTRPEPDWAALWRDLVQVRARPAVGAPDADRWAGKAEAFHDRVRRRWTDPDSSRERVLALVQQGGTVLDVGAGTGAWSVLLARTAARVTAVDASPSMLAVLRECLAAQAVSNVDVVLGVWPQVLVGDHDYSLCAHAVYGAPDLPGFVQRMVEVTRHICFLVLRTPVPGGILSDAATQLWGHPWDGPNAVIARHVLAGMGITPEVVVEARPREPRTSATLDEALELLKRHFRLHDTTAHDDDLAALLKRRLHARPGGGYAWPPDSRSVLLHWDVAPPRAG